jgi:aryl-phospho-beta-D-glucosidase BglC (GH1 family)
MNRISTPYGSGGGAGLFKHFWTEPTVYQPWTVNLWQAIAQRYANETAVAGYDLLDEPLLSESNPASGGSTVRTFYVQVAAAIRTVDKNHSARLGSTS